MVESLGIILLEDSVNDAKMIQKELDQTMKLLNNWGVTQELGFSHIQIEWVYGSDTENKREKKYKHFTDNDLPKIKDKIKDMKDKIPHIGILMDVILTRKEQSQADINDFSNVEFSKKIMDTYEQDYNIYIVTGIRNFGSRAWGIYGRENMGDRYILKDLINEYPSRKAIAGLFYWLYHKKKLPTQLANLIENRELE